MNAILLYLTLIACSDSTDKYYDWQPVGEFTSINSCEKAAKRLHMDVSRYACVSKN